MAVNSIEVVYSAYSLYMDDCEDMKVKFTKKFVKYVNWTSKKRFVRTFTDVCC